MKNRVLLIEDDKIMRVTIEDFLEARGYAVSSHDNGGDGLKAFNKEKCTLVITDVGLPDMSGFEVLKEIKNREFNSQVIIITGYGAIKDAVDAIKLGAFDYITKPFSLDELDIIMTKALELLTLKEENLSLKSELLCHDLPMLLGNTLKMKKVMELIDKTSQVDSSVLILGENGTGKELVASSIQLKSQRRYKPFIKVNCATLPEHLVESELFGYEKGAFTGAEKTKLGMFERADTGTIFLDELGSLPSFVQSKLLRVLQDGSFERLGGVETRKVDVRVIAATNRDLEKDVKDMVFREDLFYRVNVISINMPPLRERKEDIPMLTSYFTEKYSREFGRNVIFSNDAVMALLDYDFPGNVREIENIVERCIALSDSEIVSVSDLPQCIIKKYQKNLTVVSLSEVASSAEKNYILKTLIVTNRNKTKAAEILGISRKNLWEKMKAYEIES
jgi:two-component system response regulator AtoC